MPTETTEVKVDFKVIYDTLEFATMALGAAGDALTQIEGALQTFDQAANTSSATVNELADAMSGWNNLMNLIGESLAKNKGDVANLESAMETVTDTTEAAAVPTIALAATVSNLSAVVSNASSNVKEAGSTIASVSSPIKTAETSVNSLSSRIKNTFSSWDIFKSKVKDIPLKELEEDAEDAGDEAKKAGDSAEEGGKGFDDMWKQILKADIIKGVATSAFNAIKNAIGSVSDVIKDGAGAYADYDLILRQAIIKTTLETGQTMNSVYKDMSASAMSLSRNTMFSAEEIVKGMEKIAAVGDYTKTEIESIALSAATMAQAGGLKDMGTAGELLSKTYQMFGLTLADTFGDLSKAENQTNALNYAMTTLTAISNVSALDLDNVNTAMKYVGASANAAGMDITETGAMLAILSNKGIDASTAGTSLRQMFVQMAKPTQDAQDVMNQYGLSFYEANGDMKDMEDILVQLHSKIGGLNDEQRSYALTTLFGARAMTSMTALMEDGADSYIAMKNTIKDTAENVIEQVDYMNEGVGVKMEKVKNSMQSTLISLGQSIQPALSPLLDVVQEVLTQLSDIILNNPAFLALVDAFIPIIDLIKSLFIGADGAATPFLTNIIELITKLITAFMPIIELVVKFIQAFENSGALEVIVNIVIVFIGIISRLFQILTDSGVLDMFFDLIGMIGEIFTAIQPAINAFMDIIAVIFTIIAENKPTIDLLTAAIVKLVNSAVAIIVPLLQRFTKIIQENPELVESLVETLILLVDIFTELMPLIIPLVELYLVEMSIAVAAVTIILNILNIALRLISDALKFLAIPLKWIIDLLDDLMSIFGGLIDGFLDLIGDLINGLAGGGYESGKKMAEEFAKGAGDAADIDDMTQKVSDNLPASPAKEGPLSNLGKSGPGLVKTIADGAYKAVPSEFGNVTELIQRKMDNDLAPTIGISPSVDFGNTYMNSNSKNSGFGNDFASEKTVTLTIDKIEINGINDPELIADQIFGFIKKKLNNDLMTVSGR